MYQPDAYTNPYSNHYPNQYPAATAGNVAATAGLPTPLSYFPPFQAQPTIVAPAPPDPPEPAVTPRVAAKAVERLVTLELQSVGFEKAEPSTVDRLQVEVSTFVQQLFQRAHEYANLANRASVIASDVLLACDDFDLPTKELYQVKKATGKRKRNLKTQSQTHPVGLIKPRSRSPSPDLLSSDEEDLNTPGALPIPSTLSNLPNANVFPELPPKHTYRQTPASPPKKAALPSLEKKLKTAALVQESLQNLLTATEEAMNQDDGELLGHIVNWETNVQPRKRWKVKPK